MGLRSTTHVNLSHSLNVEQTEPAEVEWHGLLAKQAMSLCVRLQEAIRTGLDHACRVMFGLDTGE